MPATKKVTNTDGKKVRKTKVPREGPKKNQSAYLHFCAEERQNIKNDESSTISSKEILSEMGKRWKNLQESDPERYQKHVDEATKDKDRYAREKAEYEANKSGGDVVQADEAEQAEDEQADEVEVEEEQEPEPEPEPVKTKAKKAAVVKKEVVVEKKPVAAAKKGKKKVIDDDE